MKRFLNVFSLVLALVMVLASVQIVANAEGEDIKWDYEADVVIVGAGASGLPAALKAMADGSSVMLVEANFDVGGHVAVSEGQFHSGGHTVDQKKWNIDDSADLYYYDHTRGTSINSRYNDKDYVRSIANAMNETYSFILEKGVKVLDVEPMVRGYYRDGGNDGDSVGRMTYVDQNGWENIYTGTAAAGISVTRPLEKTLRETGAKFLMNYHMDKIYRENQTSGKVLGIQASYSPTILPGEKEPLKSLMSDGNVEETKELVNVKANKAVIICTGGSTGNVRFRTMLDPRLGPEYDGLGGMPFSDQDASGEYAAMEIGAALGSLGNYVDVVGANITAPARFGCQYGYGRGWTPKSVIWPLVRANGIVPDYHSLAIVNMLGERIGNEDEYAMAQMNTERGDFFNQALTGTFVDPDGDGNAESYGGPLWAIFDQAAVDRNEWKVDDEGVLDYENGYAFKADTLEELAEKVVNKYYENVKMDPKKLVDTITRYNEYVKNGIDEDWGRTQTMEYTIEKGPFYALWCTPSMHDTLAGLRVNANMQVMDIHGEVIPNLFCAGESSGGMRVHGLGRVITSGYVAGRAAASVDENGLATASTALNPEYAGVETNDKTKTNKAEYFNYRGLQQKTMTHSEKEAEIAQWKESGEIMPLQEVDQYPGVEAPKHENVFKGFSNNAYGGKLELEITVEDGKIAKVEVTKHEETAGVGTAAFDKLIEEAIEKQSSEIDAVAGATVTSHAFVEALEKAITEAGLK